MFTQKETQLTIVYDVHQMGSNAARIFVPPWLDPPARMRCASSPPRAAR
jgi:hypothetical protein